MALSTSSEYDDVEFLMFEHSENVARLCDIDLTCYETFYDSSPSTVENGSHDLYSKCDLECLEVFERNETNTGYCSVVPDVDYMWRDGSMHDVLNLYNIVRGELFSDFSPDDITTCFSYGVDSLTVPTTLGLHQVPTLVSSSSRSITKNSKANDITQPCLSPCTLEKAKPRAEMTDERSVNISPSPVNSTESDSQDTDARVPSSCRNDFIETGWYYIEE